MTPTWRTDRNGWPVLSGGDGSLAKWLEEQAQRRRARGVQLETSAQRQAAIGGALTTVGASAGAIGTAVPPVLIVAGIASVLGALVKAGPGGLRSSNDFDGDGVPDVERDGTRNPPTPEEAVGQHAQGWVALQLAPTMFGGARRSAPLPASEFFSAVVAAKGLDMTYYWWLLEGQPGNRAWYPSMGVLRW